MPGEVRASALIWKPCSPALERHGEIRGTKERGNEEKFNFENFKKLKKNRQ